MRYRLKKHDIGGWDDDDTLIGLDDPSEMTGQRKVLPRGGNPGIPEGS
jgi:hypothetical protein